MPLAKNVLFICTGNTCRSPLAEGLFRKAAASHVDWQISSAGVAASVGSKESQETKNVLAKRSASLDNFRSRQVTEKMLQEADLVCAMTEHHLLELHHEFPNYADKYYLLGDFIEGEFHGKSVPDPIGMGAAAYEAVADVIDQATPNILLFLES